MRLSLPELRDVEPVTATRVLNAHPGIVATRATDGTLTVQVGRDAAIVARSAEGEWRDVAVTLSTATLSTQDVARVNRLVQGWAKPIKVERNWREPKQLRVIGGPSGPVDLPARLFAARGEDVAWTVTPGVTGGTAYAAGAAVHAAAVASVTEAPEAPEAEGDSEATAPIPAPISTPVRGKGGATLPEGHPGIFREGVGAAVKMHLDDETRGRLDSALTGFIEGDPTFIVLRGPAGSGKTQAVLAVAAEYQLPTATFPVQALRDFADWAGSVMLRESAGASVTEYVPSQFIEAVSVDGPYAGIPRLVLLDEITRAETSGALNALLPVLDRQRALYVPDAKRTVFVDSAVAFAATANIGHDYTGTIELDTAFADRVTTWVRCDYTDAVTEARILIEQGGVTADEADQLVRIAAQLRAVAERLEIKRGVSTRALIEAAKHVRRRKVSPVQACLAGFGDYYSDEGGTNSDLAKVKAAIMAVASVLVAK